MTEVIPSRAHCLSTALARHEMWAAIRELKQTFRPSTRADLYWALVAARKVTQLVESHLSAVEIELVDQHFVDDYAAWLRRQDTLWGRGD